MLTGMPATPRRCLNAAAVAVALLSALGCGHGAIDKAKPTVGGGKHSGLFYSSQKDFKARAADTVEIPLRIKNTGRDIWSSSGDKPCLVSYHLLDADKKLVRWDNSRYPLPRPVKPGETCQVAARVKAPLSAGRYFLEFDLLREGLLWFKDEGSKTEMVGLTVTALEWPDDRYDMSLENKPYTRFQTSRPALNQLFKLIRLTLDHNETSFKGLTGKVSAFVAGSAYPQVWLRDANTIIPASRYFYGHEHLRSWLEEHLALQKSSGSLQDWFDLTGQSDKNTTETDQETSAVQAAAQVCRVEGCGWLADKIKAERIIDRLDKALRYVLAERWDDRTGLVKGAHTIDWGDVDIEDPDERAVAVDERTHWVVDIYDQGMFYRAALDLAWMFGRLGRKEKAFFWTVKAQSLKQGADKWLWQDDKGFYRIHVHLLESYRHAFDEDAMFAMGGNVEAVLSGLADETKSKRILEQALARQKMHGVSTVSGSLLPPYPGGTYQHPLVDDPYEYQNGGQWDWFGGRLVLALYRNGFSRLATEKLLEIAAKNLANGGFFEWDDKNGAGRGSDFFTGSAGSLARALFEGYFGLDVTADSLRIEPRAGMDRARVHAYLPDSGLFVAYDYFPAPGGRSLSLSYNSSFTGRGLVKIRLPWPIQTKDSLQSTDGDYEVTLDGRPVPFDQSRVNEDEYISVETDFKNHRIDVRRSTPGQAKPGRYLRPIE
jgi:hypothetical protein